MIRAATINDLTALVELELHCFKSGCFSRHIFRYLLTKGHAAILVDVVNNKLAGYCIVLFRKQSAIARLYSIAVDPHQHGKGAGRSLLAAAERIALKHGCNAMILEVRQDNARAIRFYENEGYQFFGVYKNFYEDKMTASRFKKFLVESALR